MEQNMEKAFKDGKITKKMLSSIYRNDLSWMVQYLKIIKNNPFTLTSGEINEKCHKNSKATVYVTKLSTWGYIIRKQLSRRRAVYGMSDKGSSLLDIMTNHVDEKQQEVKECIENKNIIEEKRQERVEDITFDEMIAMSKTSTDQSAKLQDEIDEIRMRLPAKMLVTSQESDLFSRILVVFHGARAGSHYSSLHPSYIQRQVGISLDEVVRKLNKMVQHRLLIKIQDTYFITELGTEFVLYKLLGRINDGEIMTSLIFNKIGRKAIHVIEIGETIQTICEKIGYSDEQYFYSTGNDAERKATAMEVTKILNKLHASKIILLKYHKTDDQNATIVSVNHTILDILCNIAILIEFATQFTVLDALQNNPLFSIKTRLDECMKHFRKSLVPPEAEGLEKFWLGKLSYVERASYYLEPEQVKDLYEESDSTLCDVKNIEGKHYILINEEKSLKNVRKTD